MHTNIYAARLWWAAKDVYMHKCVYIYIYMYTCIGMYIYSYICGCCSPLVGWGGCMQSGRLLTNAETVFRE